MRITHDEQKEKWDKEHAEPYALKQTDARKPSGSLPPFVEFLTQQSRRDLVGLEMGCGKGRNVIWLAEQPLIEKMCGFDFSEVAIGEAWKRAKEADVVDKAHFDVADATTVWSYEPDTFDFGIDCTASTDIEDMSGRKKAAEEMHRVIKPGGYLLVYAMSTHDEYHALMIGESPAEEKNSFYHPQTGKFEKVFTEGELDVLYEKFTLAERRRVEKSTEFFGKKYRCKLHWRVYRK